MEDASVELISAQFAALRANTELMAEVTGLYDRVPMDQVNGEPLVTYPYISLGPSTAVPDDYDCMDGEEITIQWDVWTHGDDDAYATKKLRRICNMIKRTLHGAELALTNNALVALRHELTRITDDPNPAIGHGVVQFTGVVETP